MHFQPAVYAGIDGSNLEAELLKVLCFWPASVESESFCTFVTY